LLDLYYLFTSHWSPRAQAVDEKELEEQMKELDDELDGRDLQVRSRL